MLISPQKIRNRLNQNPHNTAVDSGFINSLYNNPPRRTAVLVLFQWTGNEWVLVFIRRAIQENDRHSGQVAFPGGRIERCDSGAIDTALREANEEIGVKPDDVTILGKIQDINTITNFRITPVIGQIDYPYSFTIQRDEVQRVFTMPLNWLINPENIEIKKRSLVLKGEPFPVIYYKEYDGELLWGASAKITNDLMRILGLIKD